VDEPLAIRGIKRYLTDTFADYIPAAYPVIYQEEVAVVGAGPAGLSAAHRLALSGYRVTVFDKEPTAGGMLNVGIPEFRLPQEVVQRDIARLERGGIKFCLGRNISKALIAELKKDFDKIIIAAGTPFSKELKIEGWRKEGVLTALHFMERVNQGQAIRRHPGQAFAPKGNMVIIGGGSVAIDCARTAVRLGAKSVTVACVESGGDVPCHPWDKDEALEEGVVMLEGWAPKRFTGAFNDLEGEEFHKVTNYQKSPERILKFDTDEKETKTVAADWVVVAIGQAPSNVWKEYEGDKTILFAGDVVSGKCSVVDAMAAGIEAAIQADEALRNRSIKTTAIQRELIAAPVNEKIYPAARLQVSRPPLPIVEPAERIKNFNEVETEYLKKVIDLEVRRCLQCGYSEIDEDKCIGCGICRTVCPKGDVIAMSGIEKGGN
jgi:NADPH-dependent glutamate synthase beta subunit-like oxidoreductase